MVGGGMHRDQGLDDREGVAVGAAGDSVYRPSCGASCSAASGRRPVNAAIPHSDASGALAVYQAWCAVEVAEAEVDEPHRRRWR